jgi:hypothetical protein
MRISTLPVFSGEFGQTLIDSASTLRYLSFSRRGEVL